MNIKIVTVSLMLLAVQSILAQHDEDQIIRNEFISFMQSMEDRDFDKTLTYMVDEIFGLVSETRFKKELEKSHNNSDSKFHYANFQVHEIGDTRVIKDIRYRLISYSFEMIFELDYKRNENETRLERMNRLINMKNHMQKDTPDAYIVLDPLTGFLTVYTEYLAYAIKKDNKTWKFLTLTTGQKDLYVKILPKELISDYQRFGF